jgi:hypothetical protein
MRPRPAHRTFRQSSGGRNLPRAALRHEPSHAPTAASLIDEEACADGGNVLSRRAPANVIARWISGD